MKFSNEEVVCFCFQIAKLIKERFLLVSFCIIRKIIHNFVLELHPSICYFQGVNNFASDDGKLQ